MGDFNVLEADVYSPKDSQLVLPSPSAGAAGRKRSLLEPSKNVATSNSDSVFGTTSSGLDTPSYSLINGLSPIQTSVIEESSISSPSQRSLHPNVPAFRRARAETFSSFPSKFLPDEGLSSPLAVSASGRTRSGSLSLPPSDITSAFGQTLFSPSLWTPTDPANSAQLPFSNGSRGTSRLAKETFESISMAAKEIGQDEHDTDSIGRTLHYLGLQDGESSENLSIPTLRTNSIPQPFSPGPRSSTGSNFLHPFNRSQTVSKMQGLDPSSPLSSPIISLPQTRMRSYSVGVSDGQTSSGFNSPLAATSGVRPRSLSMGIGIKEVEVDYDDQRISPEDIMSISLEIYCPQEKSDLIVDNNSSLRVLWVGNLDASISLNDLFATFSFYGPIERLKRIPEKECAFVYYLYSQDSLKAKESLNGSKFGNNIIRIGFGKSDSSDSSAPQTTKILWLGNLPPMIDSYQLEDIFKSFGPIEMCTVFNQECCGLIYFDYVEDATEARRVMHGNEIMGFTIKIGFATFLSKSDYMSPKTDYFTPTVPSLQREGSFSSPSTYTSPPRNLPTNIFTNNQSPDARQQVFSGSFHEEGSAVSAFPPDQNNIAYTYEDTATYQPGLLPLPDPMPNRAVDQNRLRDMRKRLEGYVQPAELDMYFSETVDDIVDLSTDYIGNVVIQKIYEKSDDYHRLIMIDRIAPYMASVGVHKNGTWVVQKMIDTANSPAQTLHIVNAIQPYTPSLLLDQFGNYVVQCCLRLGTQRNQFIFDALHTKCVEIGQGRFGARAMRTCLESQHTNKRQQKHVAKAILMNAVHLITNPNGSLLITWLLDNSALPGRYQALVPKLIPTIASLCNHKLASASILKIVNQKIEMDARESLIQALFFSEDMILKEVLGDQFHGVTVIQKIISTGCITMDEKIKLADRVRNLISHMPEIKENHMGYKRILEELSLIPTANNGGTLWEQPNYGHQDIISPLTPNVQGGGFFQGSMTPVSYSSHQQHHQQHQGMSHLNPQAQSFMAQSPQMGQFVQSPYNQSPLNSSPQSYQMHNGRSDSRNN